MKSRTHLRILLATVVTLVSLPLVLSVSPGSLLTASPASADQIWYQSVGRASATAPCEESTATELADGWTNWVPSWEQWANNSKGGFVCSRQITWAFDSVPPTDSSVTSNACTTTIGGSTVIPCAVSTLGALVYGPGGGIVFYDAGSQQSWGRFMEAAPNTWSGGSEDPRLVWSGNTNTNVSTQDGVGTGSANTTAIIAQDSTAGKAATAVRAYEGGGKTDWFLPSKGELNQLYLQKTIVGGFPAESYWSSSQLVAYIAWNQYFDNGIQFNFIKISSNHVRPVRAF